MLPTLRLTPALRPAVTMAHRPGLGGNEFAIPLPGIREDQALRIAERAWAALREPFTVSDRAVWTGACIGVCFGHRGQDPQLILQDADTGLAAIVVGSRRNPNSISWPGWAAATGRGCLLGRPVPAELISLPPVRLR